MKARILVIRILAVLLQFKALNADDSTQYARWQCYKNFTSSTGSVSEQEFSGLSCPEHEIRIQAGVPIVLTCQDLVLEVGSQQYCLSIGGIKTGKKDRGFGKHRMHYLDGHGHDSNNGRKRKYDRKPHMKSSVNSNAEDGDAPAKRSKRGSAGRSNDSSSDPAKAIERLKKKLDKMEAKLEQTNALGKELMAQRLTMEIERTKGKLEDLESNYNQSMAKPKSSSSVEDTKNKKKLEKLNLKLQKQEAGILKIEKKITNLQDNPKKAKQVAKLEKKVNKLKSKSEKLQNQIKELQSLLGTTLDHTDDTNGSGYTDDGSDDNQYVTNDPDHADDVTGDNSPDGDSDNDDTNDPDHSDDVNGDDSPDGDSDNDDTNDPDHSDDVNGDDSPDGDGDDDDWPKLGNWTGPVNEGIAKPKGERWGGGERAKGRTTERSSLSVGLKANLLPSTLKLEKLVFQCAQRVHRKEVGGSLLSLQRW
ncbi:phosphatidylinositol 4-phosphate 5-kinase-like [Macrobrachium nipponense]|uniref:phosphatidylinositol 4-phosphate 5-kinase-like n=1 Tax=Macrobrachium nipponense TaxID=159736 RepID=UPI0030C8B232